MNKRIFLAAAVMGLGIVGCGALPLPIQNGVLTGELNANGHALTNVESITFGDGTVQSTAAGVGANSAFTGTVTNLSPRTVAYSTNTFIQVSGSGLAPVNDNTYATNASFGSAYGYPVYVNASQTEQILFWEAAPFGLQAGQSGWIIATNGFDQNGNTPVYFLSEGTAATPDLATNWLSVLADSGGNLIPNPINNPPPTVVSVQTISTNWVRHFNLATFTNGVCVSNTYGSITLNPLRHAGGSSGTATNLTGAATNQVNALALAQAQAVAAANAPTGFTGTQTSFLTSPVQMVVTATPVSTFAVFGLTVNGAGTTNANGDYSWDYANSDYTNITPYGGNDGTLGLLTGLFTNVIFEPGGFTSTNVGSHWELLGGDGQDLYDEGLSPVGPDYTSEAGYAPVPTISYNSTVFVVTNYTFSTNLVFAPNIFNVVTFSNGVCKTNQPTTYSPGQTFTLVTANNLSGNGGALTNLNATNLVGTIPASNLGANLSAWSAAAVLGVLAPTNVPVNTVVSAGAGVTVVSNSAAGVQTYTVSGISSNTLLGMAGEVIAGSNYLTSASSNNFAGSLNSGQVYGLGTVASLSSNTVLGMAGAAIAGSNYLTILPGNVVTNGQANVVLGGANFTLTNAGGTSATINLEAIPGISQSIQASPSGLVAAGVLLNNGTLTANALNLNNGGVITGSGANLTNIPDSALLQLPITNNQATAVNINNQFSVAASTLGSGETVFNTDGSAYFANDNVHISSGGNIQATNFVATAAGGFTGNGANLTNTPGPITTAGANVTVTPSTNAATGQITYAVASVVGVLAPTNVPVNTVVSAGAGVTVVSNSAAGVQTYTVSGISSNTLLGMAGAVIAGSNYLTSVSSNLISTAPSMLTPALDGTGTNLWMNCTNFGADVFFEYQASNNVLLNVTNVYPGSMWSLAIFNTNRAANVTIYLPTNWTSFNTTNGLSVLGGDYFFVISSNHLARVAWRTNCVGQEVSWTLYQP